MKRKATKEILAESLQELAQKKNIEKITVKEITDNCGFSTTTFYRLFHDKYDLIMWDYLSSSNAIMEKIGLEGYPWSQTLYDGLRQSNSEEDAQWKAKSISAPNADIPMIRKYVIRSTGLSLVPLLKIFRMTGNVPVAGNRKTSL